MGPSQNVENPLRWALGKANSDPNHHRTGGRKSKTWDEIALESQLFQPPIRLTWATTHELFLSTGAADSRETKTKMHHPAAPVHRGGRPSEKFGHFRTRMGFSPKNALSRALILGLVPIIM
jgi:hypothetical protein